MEIKHTIEILTKDIQDIEKLVRNLNNNPVPSAIELDLALSKLRHVYELLTMIRADSISELDVKALLADEQKKEAQKDPRAPSDSPEAETAAVSPDKTIEPEGGTTITGEEQKTAEREEITGNGEQEAETTNKEQDTAVPSSADTTSKGSGPDAVATPSEKKEKKEKEAAILAEKFKKDSSLNERITGSSQGDISSKLSGQPIDSIARNIGINDRFQIIRELLNGDSGEYAALIRKLDSAGNFNGAFHVIENRFPDDLENESVQLLVNLARRRYISTGNV